MTLKNTKEIYGWPTITLHWIIAAFLFFQLTLGLYMERLPKSDKKFALFTIHKECGLLILLLVILRLLWRISNTTPILPASLPRWQIFASQSVHYALYFCMLLMPITGWLLSSAAGASVSFFGLMMPSLMPTNTNGQLFFSNTHVILAYFLMALIALHVLAAMQHHFIYKDNILKRMFY